MDKQNIRFYFIQTKKHDYLISDFSGSAMYSGSIGQFIRTVDQMFLLNTSDNFYSDYIKAFRIKSKDVVAYGRYETVKYYSNDEIKDIELKGKFNNKPIYKIIN